jgi:pyridoxamine 5'-phosphate oxidase
VKTEQPPVEANAMTLATVSATGPPSQRVVLLKSFDDKGFVFYTNLESTKAQQIAQNNKVSLHFAWLPLDRQIIIAGGAERISAKDALSYFLSRPRDSQIAAWISDQSRRISSRQMLEQKFAEFKTKHEQEGTLSLPAFWGGYCVKPTQFEFWQGRANRLHDRFLYTPSVNGCWEINRLAP